jgi:hypothetical protein
LKQIGLISDLIIKFRSVSRMEIWKLQMMALPIPLLGIM